MGKHPILPTAYAPRPAPDTTRLPEPDADATQGTDGSQLPDGAAALSLLDKVAEALRTLTMRCWELESKLATPATDQDADTPRVDEMAPPATIAPRLTAFKSSHGRDFHIPDYRARRAAAIAADANVSDTPWFNQFRASSASQS